MRPMHFTIAYSVSILALATSASAQAILSTSWLRIEIKHDAEVACVMDRKHRHDYCSKAATKFATVRIGNRWINAVTAKRVGDRMRLTFGDVITPVACIQLRVRETGNFITLEIADIQGRGIEAIAFVNLRLRGMTQVGTVLGIATDGEFALVGLAGNIDTEWRVSRARETAVSLSARTYKRFGLERGRVALIGGPYSRIARLIDYTAMTLGLPRPRVNGTPIKYSKFNTRSYVFTSITEANADEVIEFARRGGFGAILIPNYTWATSVGHYPINKRNFPHALNGLKAVVDKCHRAGLLVGMHVWCSKVSKWDAYVTPHPDARLYKDRVATLAEDVTRLQRTIRTVESLTDWPGEERCLREGVDRSIYRYAIIGDEIIHYGGLLPDSKGLRLCERGACGTIPREHRAGDKLYHIGIDPSIRMFMVDLDTDILDEMADRVAHVFNYCGFDMVYFDGVEDVPYPFWHYVAKFQMAVWRRFKRKPIVCQGTFYVHYTWHIFSRCGTIDYMAVNPKRDLRKRALPNMLRMKANLMPAEIGWFPWRSPSGNRAGTQVDDIELLCSKATAWDCAFSVVGKVLEHANNDELLDVMGTWERLRLSGYFSEKLKRAMKPFDKQHTLLRLNNRWRILEQHPIEKPAGRDDVRAYLIDSGDGTLAAYWHTWGKGTITIRLTGEEFKLTDFKGNAVEFKRDGDMLILPLGKRYILHCGRLPRDQIATAFQKAVVEFGPGVAIWLQAEDAYKLVGGMVKGSQIGLRDDGAFGDFIVSRIPATPRAIPECYAEYRIRVPHAGAYYIWGRFKYPSGGGQSFAFILAGEPATGALSKAIGNSAVKALQWHWDSQSSGDAIPPGSGRRMVRFKKGINTFRIYAREASDDPKRNPRLDMILITDNAIYVPKDADAMQRVN